MVIVITPIEKKKKNCDNFGFVVLKLVLILALIFADLLTNLIWILSDLRFDWNLIIYIERELTLNIDLGSIINNFYSLKDNKTQIK